MIQLTEHSMLSARSFFWRLITATAKSTLCHFGQMLLKVKIFRPCFADQALINGAIFLGTPIRIVGTRMRENVDFLHFVTFGRLMRSFIIPRHQHPTRTVGFVALPPQSCQFPQIMRLTHPLATFALFMQQFFSSSGIFFVQRFPLTIYIRNRIPFDIKLFTYFCFIPNGCSIFIVKKIIGFHILSCFCRVINNHTKKEADHG